MRASLFLLLIVVVVVVVLGSLRGFVCRQTPQADGRHNASATSDPVVELRVGFLVGRQRLKWDRLYSRPGRQLIHVFNYAIDKINQHFYRPSWSNKVSPAGAPDDELETSDVKQQHDVNYANNSNSNNLNQSSNQLGSILFKAISAETYGNESESIKQTVELMLRHQVHVIVGPQETCQMEPQLASIFDVPMISHYCSHWPSSSSAAATRLSTATLVEAKPPHWKIVQRVATLVGRLLDSYDAYPQQLVLLYYKETRAPSRMSVPTTATGDIPKANNNNQTHRFVPTIESQTNHLGASSNEAIQYKLIGELLEVRLRELLEANLKLTPTNRNKLNRLPLTVLNWHTTFHYGYTRNPFRALLRRHLLSGGVGGQFNQSALMNQHDQCGAANLTRTTTTMPAKTQRHSQQSQRAIYIVVGHYYEHLGLMLSLDELGLLSALDDNDRHRPRRPTSVVLGVDIEPYDERDDSARFLRGLLMDNDEHKDNIDRPEETTAAGSGGAQEPSASSSSPADNLNSMASKYNHYLGVFPSRPTRMAELLDEMRLFYNKTIQSAHQTNQLAPRADDVWQRNRTIDESVLFSSRLLQFIRLPVEAFYLYDSLTLLADYFNECLTKQQKPLAECQSGRRMRGWFSNRNYSSYASQERTRFDSMARAEGSYTLIGRRHSLVSQSNSPEVGESNEDEFGLAPIGRFVRTTAGGGGGGGGGGGADMDQEHDNIQLIVNSADIDQVWLPFWCRNQIIAAGGGAIVATSECQRFLTSGQNDSKTTEVIEAFERSKGEAARLATSTVVLVLVVVSMSCLSLVWAMRRRRFKLSAAVEGAKQTDFKLLSMFETSPALLSPSSSFSSKDKNRQWFSQQDERNFLHIVQNLLLFSETIDDHVVVGSNLIIQRNELKYPPPPPSPATDKDTNLWPRNLNTATGNSEIDITTRLFEATNLPETDAIELHCHMFPFPSCKFVHWLTALHQLKEMLFQFQSNSTGNGQKSARSTISRRLLNLFDGRDSNNNNSNDQKDDDIDSRPTARNRRLSRCFPVRLSGRNNTTTGEEEERATSWSAASVSGSFFTSKHKGTQSLRLLLNKYKSINQCLCNLSLSRHQTIVGLIGVTLSHDICGTTNTKMAKLIVEQTERYNLRVAMRFLNSNLLKSAESSLLLSTPTTHQQEQEIQLNQYATQTFRCKLFSVLLSDLLDGLEYLHHNSPLGFHGELRTSNCLITAHWRLKLSGFHVTHMRRSLGAYELQAQAHCAKYNFEQEDDNIIYDQLIYLAPELLANYNKCNALSDHEMKSTDIYSLAYIIYELLTGLEPWGVLLDGKRYSSNKLLLDTLRVNASFRPPLDRLDSFFESMQCVVTKRASWSHNNVNHNDNYNSSKLKALLESCWSQSPTKRPQSIGMLRRHLEVSVKPLALSLKARDGTELNNVVALYTKLLERKLIVMRDNLTQVESHIQELRMSLFPQRFKLSEEASVQPKQLAGVTLCMFRFILLPEASGEWNSCSASDQVNRSASAVALRFTQFLNDVICQLDELVGSYRNHIHLMDSQVDSMLRYLAVVSKDEQPTRAAAYSKIHPNDDPYHENQILASFALQLIDLANRFKGRLEVRCGLHCGSASATCLKLSELNSHMNIVNVNCKTFRLSRWVLIGPALQTVDWLEQTSQPQHIHISDKYHDQLKKFADLSSVSYDVCRANDKGKPGVAHVGGVGMGGGTCRRGAGVNVNSVLRGITGDNLGLMSSDYIKADYRTDNNSLNHIHQGYIMIKSGNKISTSYGSSSNNFFSLETYWLLNGPRLSPSQKLTLS